MDSDKQSGFGIASVVLSIIGAVACFAVVVMAGIMENSTPGGIDEESPQAILLGLGILGAVGMQILAAALGVAGLFHPNRGRVAAVFGLVFSLGTIVAICGLMAVGLSMG